MEKLVLSDFFIIARGLQMVDGIVQFFFFTKDLNFFFIRLFQFFTGYLSKEKDQAKHLLVDKMYTSKCEPLFTLSLEFLDSPKKKILLGGNLFQMP